MKILKIVIYSFCIIQAINAIDILLSDEEIANNNGQSLATLIKRKQGESYSNQIYVRNRNMLTALSNKLDTYDPKVTSDLISKIGVGIPLSSDFINNKSANDIFGFLKQEYLKPYRYKSSYYTPNQPLKTILNTKLQNLINDRNTKQEDRDILNDVLSSIEVWQAPDIIRVAQPQQSSQPQQLQSQTYPQGQTTFQPTTGMGQQPYTGTGSPYTGSSPQYSGSGTQYSGSGSQYPGYGAQHSGTGPQYTGSGSQYSVSGSQYPGSGTQYAGSATHYSGSGTQYSGSGSMTQYSGSGAYPGSGIQYPGSVPQYQSYGTQYSGSGVPQYGQTLPPQPSGLVAKPVLPPTPAGLPKGTITADEKAPSDRFFLKEFAKIPFADAQLDDKGYLDHISRELDKIAKNPAYKKGGGKSNFNLMSAFNRLKEALTDPKNEDSFQKKPNQSENVFLTNAEKNFKNKFGVMINLYEPFFPAIFDTSDENKNKIILAIKAIVASYVDRQIANTENPAESVKNSSNEQAKEFLQHLVNDIDDMLKDQANYEGSPDNIRLKVDYIPQLYENLVVLQMNPKFFKSEGLTKRISEKGKNELKLKVNMPLLQYLGSKNLDLLEIKKYMKNLFYPFVSASDKEDKDKKAKQQPQYPDLDKDQFVRGLNRALKIIVDSHNPPQQNQPEQKNKI